ncbi:hypothetical protein [Streptomyces sp. NPDC057403]|uniref:hypothetical protein n=1 Tax=Streptomyces sp. NPDC057403 TaxID=3346119 RepID=UPI0036A38889
MTPTKTPLRGTSRITASTGLRKPLRDIAPHAASTARSMGRVTDVPDDRSKQAITFNSAA